jgi:uncharacterized membrane protein
MYLALRIMSNPNLSKKYTMTYYPLIDWSGVMFAAGFPTEP